MAKLEDDLKVKVKVASPEIRVGTTVMNSVAFKEIIHNDTLIGNGDKEPLGVAPEILSDISTAKSDIAGLKTDLSTTDANVAEIDEKFENYLPLSGGTLTGQLGINSKGYIDHPILMDGYDELQIGYYSPITDSLIRVFRFKLDNGMFLPYANKVATLGDSTRIWKTVYATQLNNGADLIIPTEGGTLARVEDIDAIGGDGTAGQVLTKTADGMAWQDASGGGGLPDQTDNAGKFLTTDGSEASWSDKPLVNNGDESQHNFCVGKYSAASGNYNVCVGEHATSYGGNYNTVVGYRSQIRNAGTVIGSYVQISNDKQNVAIIASGNKSIYYGSGIESDSFFWVLNDTPYKLCSSDGTIPLERLTHVTDQIGDISTALTAILGE